MCGRYSLTQDPTDFLSRLGVATSTARDGIFRPRYNIAPSQLVLAVVAPGNGPPQVVKMQWGLIPHWTKNPQTLRRPLINARSETVAQRPAFRDAFRRRRCIIPADGFYEWQTRKDGRRKQPYRITLKNESVFGFAGLWDRWIDPGGTTVLTCTILTTTANELVGTIHNRMPVILPEDALDLWLDSGSSISSQLSRLMAPYPAGEMRAYPVSTSVNSPRNDNPSCIRPVT